MVREVTVPDARVPLRMWADPGDVEEQAMRQLGNIARLPWVDGVAVMPDVHYGKGATVGSVIAMRQAVSPAAVGVDIGCGMTAVRTSLTAKHLPDDLARLRAAIEAAVPVGFHAHSEPVDATAVTSLGGWRDFWAGFDDLTSAVRPLRDRAMKQLGTLGGGNHFLEICLDTDGRVWIMLHSGSRNIGKELAEHHIGVAQRLPHNTDLPDRDLAVFLRGSAEMTAYRRDLFWAQEYAQRNRAVMTALVTDVVRREFARLEPTFDEPISCHHNYVAEETHEGMDVYVTRKGAIRAGRGEYGLIPGSMGTGSYVVRGLGNPASFESASHGAGRRMSRTAARKRYTARDLAAQTEGVECRKDAGVVDEIPAAYKNIKRVIEAQRDLVEVVAHLRQVLCVKG